MAAVAEAEAAADLRECAELGSRLRISPATPTIVYKRARPSRTAGADGSCRPALFTSAATAPAAGPGKAESDGFAPVPSPAQERPQSAPEDSGEVECATVSTQESSTLPPLVGKSSGKVAQQEQQQQEEAIASGSDAGAAAPVPTPEKVEYTPRRRWKKSTKGVLRFKVVKDKVMKPKITPKTATPRKVKKDKKKQTPEAEDGSQHVGAGGCNRARRKLDLDSSQTKTCFSRAELMGNLKDLAKSHGLSVEPTRRPRSKRGRKRKLMTVPYQGTPTGASSSSLVPHWGSDQSIVRHGNHGKRLLNKVLGLNQETLRVCDVLAKWDGSDSESFEGFDIGSGPEWDKTRHWFEQLVDIFIAEMDDLIGPRKFSLWGGSLIDSVVGTFLTQNVADNLSSHAFMNLAAKFPPRKRCHKAEDCSNTALLVDGVDENLNSKEASDTFDSADSDFEEYIDSEEEDGQDGDIKGHYGEEYNRLIENFIANIKERDISTWESDLMNLVKDKSGNPICTERTLRKFITSLQQPVTSSIWKELREEAYQKGYSDKSGTSDAVDWESVLHAPIAEVANCIKVRGQHYILAVRIQVFLMHVNNAQDGNFDLDWLRYISREKAKKFLLSIYGIGMKSADCIRLLSLRHKAFPVDVNVARIVTRLGWVELQPLNGAEFHLVSSYPIMRDVQKYLWPRLCTIDKEKLYELHYLMITFGKVLCTKINPNCSACPFSANCKYYNSSFARKALPPPENHEHEQGEQQASMIASGRFLLSNDGCMPSSQQMYQYQNENGRTAETPPIHNCEPIVEMPQSPEYEYEEAPNEQEDSYGDYLCDLEDTVPEGVEFDGEIDLCSSKHGLNHRSWTPNCGKDLVVINPKSGRNKKLKNIGRLRTEHNAYVLPDDHVILEEFEERVPEDICPYLLVVISCPDDYTVTGTVLIPCRTANRGKFPLNGTYFQENEVFADHSSSRHPITIPRECIGRLDRSIVYFGSSIHSITRGQTRRDIQECFKEGYVCVRGFHRRTRTPMRICGKLHATSTVKKETMKKEVGKKEAEKRAKRAKTSPVGKSKEKASMAN